MARWAILLIVAAIAGALAQPASATFPGRNGAIVYGWTGESAFRAGPTATSIRAVNPRSGAWRVLRDCPLRSDALRTVVVDCGVGAPRVSPDGGTIAFPTTRGVLEGTAARYEPGLGTMASDGSGFEEHATAMAWSTLAWSPTVNRLLAERAGAGGIFLASRNGARLRELTAGTAPDWSSTGRIAFARSNVYVARPGGASRRLTRLGGLSPSWSPDGRKLAFVRLAGGRSDVYVVRRDGRGLRRLTRRGGSSPRWSPDGRRIAFIRRGDIYVVRARGGGLRRLVDAPSRDPLDTRGGFATALDWQPLPARPGAAKARPAGALLDAKPLRRGLWIPRTTARAFKLTYVTKDARGRRARSTGTLFLPKGRAPRGGWPVVSWAHGTSGLGDSCAPSRVGPALPERDRPYLANWMREGYAIVASDYAGLGTRGVMAYLNGRSEAHNIVDIVKAGRAYARRLPRSSRLARKWVVVGQSQGGGAAIYTARYATRFGGRRLDYRGAVGTGVPAYIENVVAALGPSFPTVSVGTTAYMAYILAGLRWTYPKLGVDSVLSAAGRRFVNLAETECVFEFEKELAGAELGGFFTRDLSALPNIERTLSRYMAMPESGFDRPFFMGHGRDDADVPYSLTLPYVRALRANGEPLTFKAYDFDHSGTLLASQRDTHPFVRRLFARR